MLTRCAVGMALLALAGTAPAAGDRFEPIRSSIRELLAGRRVPSLAVAVAKDGKIIWEEGFGWADRENRVPATAHTIYSLASVTKPMTATALMVLRERGRVELDRPVNDYLGEAKLRARAGGGPATVRQVASHCSGLPLHYQFFYEDEPYRPPPMDETIRRYGNLITPPGERYQYSNLGYGVLDYVISRVSGRSYPDFLREEVFLPLGMHHSLVRTGSGPGKRYAARYGEDGNPIAFYDFDHRGGSAAWACAHDLIRFGMFHLRVRAPDQKPILPDRAIDEMQKPVVWQSEGAGYGLGWMIRHNGPYRVVWHSGGMGGVSAELVLVPAARLAVAVLANARTDVPQRIRREILALLAPDQTAPDGPAGIPGARRPPKELTGGWVGAVSTYRREVPFRLTILDSGAVEAGLDAQPAVRVEGVTWKDGQLSGRLTGDLGTEDVNRRPYFLNLSLHLRGSVLNGGLSAISLPGPRAGNALTHWVELKKQP